jgi:DegV family protein with EDD domain
MASIAIVTDTDSSLPADIAARYGVRQVPIAIHFGEEHFASEVDIDTAQVFERVDREGKLPTTAAPSPGRFAEAYQAAFDEGAEAVVCLCVSSKISATYSAAVAACDLMPERDVTVVDTLNLSMGQGFMVLAAAEAAAEGASKEEVVARAEEVGQRTHVYAALSTLKYLAMSGRVGHLAAGMAGLLSIKPILTIREGGLDLLEQVRTRKKAWARVVELAMAALGDGAPERVAIVHTDALRDARAFEEQFRERQDYPGEIIITDLTAGLSVHTGTGLVGVGILAGK